MTSADRHRPVLSPELEKQGICPWARGSPFQTGPVETDAVGPLPEWTTYCANPEDFSAGV